MKQRKGYGLGKGMGYKNLMPMDSYIHSLSAKGMKTYTRDCFLRHLRPLQTRTQGFDIGKHIIDRATLSGEQYGRLAERLSEANADVLTIGDESLKFTIMKSGGKKTGWKHTLLRLEESLSAKGKKKSLYAKAYSKPKMADEITKFVKKLKKRYGDKDDNFVVDIETESVSGNVKGSKYIQLRTDSLVYEQLFDPSMSEQPYLIRDANAEFGGKMKVPTGYEDQEAFRKLLQKHGWDYELYGQGIIEIYKQD